MKENEEPWQVGLLWSLPVSQTPLHIDALCFRIPTSPVKAVFPCVRVFIAWYIKIISLDWMHSFKLVQ